MALYNGNGSEIDSNLEVIVMPEPGNWKVIFSAGYKKNDPEYTGITVGQQHDFEQEVNIGTVVEGNPIRDRKGGPVKAYVFKYPFEDLYILGYLTGEDLTILENQNNADPNAKFFDVVPKLGDFLGEILPNQVREYIKVNNISNEIEAGAMEILDRNEIWLKSLDEFREKKKGFTHLNNNLFAENIGYAFKKAYKASEGGNFEDLKTDSSNRSFNYFIDLRDKMASADNFLSDYESFVEILGKGLIEVISDWYNPFTGLQTKEDPRKIAYKEVKEHLSKLAESTSNTFLLLVTKIMKEEETNLHAMLDEISMYDLEKNEDKINQDFADLIYSRLAKTAPFELLANPYIEDLSSPGDNEIKFENFFKQQIRVKVHHAILERNLFGKIEGEINGSLTRRLDEYNRFFVNKILERYSPSGYEPVAASLLYSLIPEVIQDIGKNLRKEKNKQLPAKQVLELINKLKDNQFDFINFDAVTDTRETWKSALVSTLFEVFVKTFSISNNGHCFRKALSETGKIQKTARQIYKISQIANAIGESDFPLFNPLKFMPGAKQMLTSLEKGTVYSFTIGEKTYDTLYDADTIELEDLVRDIFESDYVSLLRDQKDKFYSKLLNKIKSVDKIVKTISYVSDQGNVKSKLGKIKNLEWDKKIEDSKFNHCLALELKNNLYNKIAENLGKFNKDLMTNLEFTKKNLDPEHLGDLVDNWKKYSKSVGDFYDSMKKDMDSDFNRLVKTLSSSIKESVLNAKTKSDLEKLGLNVTKVSSRPVYIFTDNKDSIVSRYDEKMYPSIEVLSKLWDYLKGRYRVCSLLEENITKMINSQFFNKVNMLIETYSKKGIDPKDPKKIQKPEIASEFSKAYSNIVKSFNKKFEEQDILEKIDEFSQSYYSRLNKEAGNKKKLSQNLWDNLLDELEDLKQKNKKSIMNILSLEIYNLENSKDFISSLQSNHPVCIADPEENFAYLRYDYKQVMNTIRLRTVSDLAETTLHETQNGVDKIEGIVSTKIKEGLGLDEYISNIFNDVWPKSFGSDKENIYKVFTKDGKNYFVVSELNHQLDPKKIFGPGVVTPIKENGKQYLAIQLPDHEPVPEQVNDLSKYAIFVAELYFKQLLAPSEKFLEKAASFVNDSVRTSTLAFLANLKDKFSYQK